MVKHEDHTVSINAPSNISQSLACGRKVERAAAPIQGIALPSRTNVPARDPCLAYRIGDVETRVRRRCKLLIQNAKVRSDTLSDTSPHTFNHVKQCDVGCLLPLTLVRQD